ncbi:hypothetical protein, partial [Pseudomonas syringae]|uniref:hypothetical protein n=1 Tax=Pseudomonas syringae TaxID=317 RepID=UPI001F3BD621
MNIAARSSLLKTVLLPPVQPRRLFQNPFCAFCFYNAAQSFLPHATPDRVLASGALMEFNPLDLILH